MQLSSSSRLLVAALVAASMTAIPFADALPHAGAAEELATVEHLADPDVDRRETPEDAYAMALGCYELADASGVVLGRDGDAYTTTAPSPLHFEPTALGSYLLLDVQGDVVAAAGGPAEQAEGLVADVEYVAPAERTTDVPRSVRDDAPSPVVDDPLGLAPTVDTHTGAVVPGTAGPSADWRARRNTDGTFTLTLDVASGRALGIVGGTATLVGATDPAARLSLRSVDETGCAEWPEVDVNVEGPILAGETPWDETRGTIDGHLHLMAFEFLGGELRCGRPWHPYGVTEAMGDCAQNALLGGQVQEAALGDGPESFGDDVMWPEFTVPTPRTLTYEQVYHRWLERAWRGGLRMMTVLMVENNVLCELWPDKRNSCNEMDSVRLQVQRLHELVDYLDARAGGPGEGWAQIVTDPFQAREVINSGRLALIMGIEVSVLFDCREYLGTSQCTNADIVQQMDEIQDLGIVQMELVNKFDNALSGVKGDGGQTGIVVNNGNREDTGHFWKFDTCPEERAHGSDRTQTNLVDEAEGTPFEPLARDPLAAQILSATGTSGVAPVYPDGPHCNTIGLTEQGEFALTEIASRGLVFDPDHMSALGAMQALDVMEELGYSGVMSSHGWADDLIYERVYTLGGTVTQYAGGSSGFAGGWRKAQDWVDDRYYFGYGYGADTNGLGGQGGPRNPAEDADVDYPFTAPGGALVYPQTSGTRAPYDINTDGVAHYGMYPDWVEDLRVQEGEAIITDMLRGPESYLQMWERAVGVAKDACTFGVGATDTTDGLRVGMTVEQALRAAGQPRVRDAAGYTWCGVRDNGSPSHVTASFDAAGRVAQLAERPATSPLPGVNDGRTGASSSAGFARTDVDHSHGPDHQH